jgi:hypothetical protein
LQSSSEIAALIKRYWRDAVNMIGENRTLL